MNTAIRKVSSTRVALRWAATSLVCALALLAPPAALAEPYACKDLPAQMQNVDSLEPELQSKRFYVLDRLMQATFDGHEPAAAEPLALEYLYVARLHLGNWNYGNAIHDANSMLGLVALRAGKIDQAISCLKAAGSSPGSPQLNTFGPQMELARELAIAGKYGAVAEYLESVRAFWKMENGHIDIWLAELASGLVPDFGKSLRCSTQVRLRLSRSQGILNESLIRPY